mgnify:CR=1 FL=1
MQRIYEPQDLMEGELLLGMLESVASGYLDPLLGGGTRELVVAAVGVPLIGRSLFLEGAARYRTRQDNRAFFEDFSSFGGDLTLVWRF